MVESSNSKPVAIIFGASLSGKSALKIVAESYDVIAFVDNSLEKQGTTVSNIPVYAASKIPQLIFDKILIASEFFEKIQRQLINDYGIEQDKINVLPSSCTKPIQFGNDVEFRKLSVQILHLICRALNQAKVPYYVDAGSLLGIYRDAALIPWDDDLDIAIPSHSLDLTKNVINRSLPDLEKLTGEVWELKTYFSDQNFGGVKLGDVRCFKLSSKTHNSTLPMMDVFVKYIQGDMMDYAMASRGIRMPSEHILSLDTIEFEGLIINIPSKTALYLERHYGDWQTPEKKWDLSMLQSTTLFG